MKKEYAEPFLRLCLDSLVRQTCTDDEIVVVDDGSADESGVVCDEHAARIPSLTVIHQKNQDFPGRGTRDCARRQANGSLLWMVMTGPTRICWRSCRGIFWPPDQTCIRQVLSGLPAVERAPC